MAQHEQSAATGRFHEQNRPFLYKYAFMAHSTAESVGNQNRIPCSGRRHEHSRMPAEALIGAGLSARRFLLGW